MLKSGFSNIKLFRRTLLLCAVCQFQYFIYFACTLGCCRVLIVQALTAARNGGGGGGGEGGAQAGREGHFSQPTFLIEYDAPRLTQTQL